MPISIADLDLNVPGDILSTDIVEGEHDHIQYYKLPVGEHYRLLRHLAQQHQGTVIVDIGTHLGFSAFALSDSNNRVITLDIENKRLKTLRLPPNVTCVIANMIDDPSVFPDDASLALLDIDPHDGVKERAIVQQLLDRKWHGTLVCDDIHLNPGMRSFWSWIADKCLTRDVTHLAHCTGTGLVQL